MTRCARPRKHPFLQLARRDTPRVGDELEAVRRQDLAVHPVARGGIELVGVADDVDAQRIEVTWRHRERRIGGGVFAARLVAGGNQIAALPVPIAQQFRARTQATGYPALGEANSLLDR